MSNRFLMASVLGMALAASAEAAAGRPLDFTPDPSRRKDPNNPLDRERMSKADAKRERRRQRNLRTRNGAKP